MTIYPDTQRRAPCKSREGSCGSSMCPLQFVCIYHVNSIFYYLKDSYLYERKGVRKSDRRVPEPEVEEGPIVYTDCPGCGMGHVMDEKECLNCGQNLILFQL